MAVKGVADRVLMFKGNQPEVTPPIAFQDLNDANQFSISIWAKVTDVITADVVFAYTAEAADIRIGHYQGFWYVQIHENNVILNTSNLFPVTEGRWVVFGLSRSGPNITVYAGQEPAVPDKDTPLNMIPLANLVIHLNSLFRFLHVITSHTLAICNLKYWNVALTEAEFEEQAQRWDATSPGGGQTPMWASTLRTPGDISSIANPYTSQDWALGHAYSTIIPNDTSFQIELPDPAYMAEHQPCPTWIYALPSDNPKFNPGTTPIVNTTYKAPQFWRMQDRGSIPKIVFLNQITATYYAFPFAIGPGVHQDSSWALVIDENGTELSPNFGDPTNKFEQDTGVAIPGAAGIFTTLNMYLYRFGGQFTWLANPTPTATAQANLGFPHLLVTYIGYVTGTQILPVETLTGLFVTRRDGIAVDRYNNQVDFRIPDPTIRTAFVGE